MIDGKVAIVTGAAQGVGRGIALALAREGALIALCDLAHDKLSEVKAEIDSFGGDAIALGCDVGVADDIKRVVETVLATWSGIDILVNNAYGGVVSGSLLNETDEALFIEGFDTGPLATLRFMRAVHPHMKARGGGAIINLGTSGGVRWDMRGYGPYGAVKEAIRVLTRAAACEWGIDGIRVNTVAPLALSPALEWWTESNPAEAAAFLETVPQRRAGDCEIDIGRAVLFLVGPDARFVSGATLPLDGGQARFG